jgi:hypothetical protein
LRVFTEAAIRNDGSDGFEPDPEFGRAKQSVCKIVRSRSTRVKPATPEAQAALKEKYLRKAIEEYEYSPSSEYDKASMSHRAVAEGTLDFDYHNAQSAVELSIDGAWVSARVWLPKKWLDKNGVTK